MLRSTPSTLCIGLAAVLVVAGALAGCDTGVEPSEQPGTLRVLIEADPADSTIVLVSDPVGVRPGDGFTVTAFQGKVFSDSVYFTLYPTTTSYRQRDQVFDPIDGMTNPEVGPDTLFSSFLPPGRYDRVQFGLTASELRIGGFTVPVAPEPGATLLLDLPVDFEIVEEGTTEVRLVMHPLASVSRYRNVFRFDPEVEVGGVQMGSPR